MRKVILFFLILVFWDSKVMAQSESHVIRILPNGEVISISGENTSRVGAASLPEKERAGMRPADDSDKDMQKLWSEIVHTPSCDTVLVLCEPRLGKIKSGGNRLAEYLISQYELSEIESEGTGDSYLRFIGATGERGKNYLLEKASNQKTMQIGLEGLLFAESVEAIDKAIWILSQKDPRLPNVLAVNVIRLNMITSGTIREGDVSFLRRLEVDKEFDLRGYASRALKDLEARGLIATDINYPHPEDLKMWVPNPIKYD